MSDRKNVNKYYPPDFDPSKGSLNTQQGQHVLRKRANKLSEGILVIRFEMPFNCWCLGCSAHIGKGVRYNAEKSAAGKYFSTTIWNFRMKCHLCNHPFLIRTDPKTAQYLCVEGLRAKDESFSAADNHTIELLDAEEKARMRTDALFATEHGEKDKSAAASEHKRLGELFGVQERMGDDFAMNQRLRATFRNRKQAEAAAVQEGAARGIAFPLLPASSEDGDVSSAVEFGSRDRQETERRQQLKRMRIEQGNIFGSAHTAAAAASSVAAASSGSVAAASSSSSSSESLRARAIQRALDKGINVHSFVPLSHAPAALYSSRPPSLLASPSMPQLVRVAPQSASSAVPAAAAAATDPGSGKSKRKRSSPSSSNHASATQTSAAPPTEAHCAAEPAAGVLGLAAYDSD